MYDTYALENNDRQWSVELDNRSSLAALLLVGGTFFHEVDDDDGGGVVVVLAASIITDLLDSNLRDEVLLSLCWSHTCICLGWSMHMHMHRSS